VEIRAKAAILGAGAAGLALVLRFFPPDQYPIYPICVWRAATGWRCPGCGSTHAIAALLAGRWSDAVHYNAMAVAVAPVMAAVFARNLYRAWRYNTWDHRSTRRL
jgi:hypothetical protein